MAQQAVIITPMNDPNRKPSGDSKSDLPAPISKSSNLLDAALANLPAEQQQTLAEKAIERRLDLDADAKRAELRFHTSSADMAKTVDFVRELENSTKSDYTVSSQYHTASGHTNVEIKKSNNLIIIVIAVVIALIVGFIFYR